MSAATWTPERTQAFQTMVSAGRSRAELAAKFGLSESSVRARINRMGVSAFPSRPEPEPGPVKLVDTLDFHCRFSVEPENAIPTANMMVCGKRVIPGKSWCPECSRRVWSREAPVTRGSAYAPFPSRADGFPSHQI